MAKLWAGDADSLELMLNLLAKKENAPEDVRIRLDGMGGGMGAADGEMEPESDLLEIEGQIAVITIKGPMIDGRLGDWCSWLEMVGYEDIKEAILEGIELGATHFIFDWDTPGGSVAGIEEMSNFIKDLAKIHTTVSYTSGTCCSAGLWLATAADTFYASKMAQVGSLGVIAIHREYTKMMEMDGITPTVMRSAPFKALGNPYEKLSDKAKKKIEEDIAIAHSFFVDAITENCEIPRQFVEENIATGEVWYAMQAKDKGLIDDVKPYRDVYGELSELAAEGGQEEDDPLTGTQRVASKQLSVENTSDYNPDHPEVTMKRKTITAQAQAAIASGVPVDVALQDAPAEEVETETPAEETQTENTGEGEAEGEAEGTTEASAQADMSLVNQLVDTKVALAKALDKVAQMEASHTSMKAIVVSAIQRATVGMGGTAPSTESLSALDASVLVAQHAEVQKQLDKRFGIGGRYSDATEESSEEDAAVAQISAHNEDVLLGLARFKPTK